LYDVALPQGFDSNKEYFAFMFLYICCCDFLFSLWFLTIGIKELSLADIVGNFFLFLQIFFGEEKRGPRHYQNFQYISMENLQKKIVYLIFSQKNTQFEKKNRLKRSLGNLDIEVLKSAKFSRFFPRTTT
jgi:hypothetical protein